MKKTIFILTSLFNLAIFSQTKPFPANVTFTNGLMATSKNSQDASSSYDTWKTNFVEACNNGRYRVKFDDKSQTVSEGVAYGMLLTAYKADKSIFDGLWLYYKDNVNVNGVMNWKISGCSGTIGQNGASDAELDAAFALIVADYQWGSAGTINYKDEAKKMIAIVKKYEIESNTFVLKPGDNFGGSNLTNPSYYCPAYYRIFGSYTNDTAFWNSMVSKSYEIINNNLTVNKAAGGLVSDWCMASGAYSNDASGYASQGKKYTYDAARTPWRIAVDYVWNGAADAKTYSKKTSDFVRVTLGGTANIKDGYNQDGTASGQWHNPTFVGGFACAAMGGENQSHLDASYNDLKNLSEPDNYFHQTLKTLYLFLLTGNFYMPQNTLSANDFNKNALKVSVYPNPTSGNFTVTSPKNTKIRVLSTHSKVLFEEVSNAETTQIDLKNQTPGVYMLEFVKDNSRAVKKIIIK